MGVIFDLDQTIVDSTIAAKLRKEKNWSRVYSLIPKFAIYDGIKGVFDFLDKSGIQMVVVSTSPRPYCDRVVESINMNCKYIVSYHDAKPIKPHAAPMLKALELLKMKPAQAISIGDRAIDIQSSRGAGITSVGCLWGSEEEELLKESEPNYLINSPHEFIPLIRQHFKI